MIKPLRLSKRCMALLLLLSLLALTACGSRAEAATMYLKHTEGTVAVSDDAGKEVPLLEDLGLYSGYGVDTRSESYAWISLDDVKLTKMDQDSEIAIKKEGRNLEIEVISGALFFNVTRPLEEDETMTIRSSTMMTGIRGTCGWVSLSEDGEQMSVWLLEGRVSCEAGGKQETVRAGEMAVLTRSGEITVTGFAASDVPAFVLEEIEEDDSLARKILEDSGIDVLNPEDPAIVQYRAILSQADTFFDYEYSGDDEPEISYKYALVQMQTGYQIPALVLEQEVISYWDGDVCSAKVFQYDPDSQTVIRVEEALREGVASAGGYRGTLALAGDGIGILETSWSSGNGMGQIRLAMMEGNGLRWDTVFDGFLFDEPSPMETVGSLPISWFDLSDSGGLDNWASGAVPQPSGTPESDAAFQPSDTPEPDGGGESLLAPYAGTYTAYETFHDGYGGGSPLKDVTLAEDGVVTGGGTSFYDFESNGVMPSSVEEQADGSIVIRFSQDEYYTLYPAGVALGSYEDVVDSGNVNLRYFCFDGGVMEIVYYKLP